MKKTTLVVVFSFFNLLFLRANTYIADPNFDVTVSLIGEVLEYHDYDFLSTYDWQFEYGPTEFKPVQGTIMQHLGRSLLGDVAQVDNLIFAKKEANLSVPENNVANFKYYPNPVENILSIESNSIISKIEIYSVTGNLIFTNDYSESKVNMDFKKYATGMYLVNLIADDKKEVFKVIKK